MTSVLHWCPMGVRKSQAAPTATYAARYADLRHTLSSITGGFLAPVFFAYLGLEFDCEFELQVNPDQIPRARLNGGAQLGRTAWLGQMQIHLRKQQPATVRVKCPAVPSHSSLFRSST